MKIQFIRCRGCKWKCYQLYCRLCKNLLIWLPPPSHISHAMSFLFGQDSTPDSPLTMTGESEKQHKKQWLNVSEKSIPRLCGQCVLSYDQVDSRSASFREFQLARLSFKTKLAVAFIILVKPDSWKREGGHFLVKWMIHVSSMLNSRHSFFFVWQWLPRREEILLHSWSNWCPHGFSALWTHMLLQPQQPPRPWPRLSLTKEKFETQSSSVKKKCSSSWRIWSTTKRWRHWVISSKCPYSTKPSLKSNKMKDRSNSTVLLYYSWPLHLPGKPVKRMQKASTFAWLPPHFSPMEGKSRNPVVTCRDSILN